MSEKRFEKSKSDITDYRIYDYEKEDAYFIDCDDESTVDAIVDLMNRQQATIKRLQDLCGKSDYENAKLRLKNKELQEMNGQLREINKELGDDLHNCRLNKNIIREKLKLWQDVHKKYGIYNINDFEELMKSIK